MKMIVGLGNPGDKYKNTRHNLGFMALDSILEKEEPVNKTIWKAEGKRAEFKRLKIKNEDVILVKPQSFMNNSGEEVGYFAQMYKIAPQDIIVIHDDLDIPFGNIRVRFGGGSGGHKGVQSVIDRLKNENFLRIRMGIERNIRGIDSDTKSYRAFEDYVLEEFDTDEVGKVRVMVEKVPKILELILEHGGEKYMSKYNKES